MRLPHPVLALTALAVGSTLWGADYTEPASTNAFGRRHEGDKVRATANVPGRVISGEVQNAGGWLWIPIDFTHFDGTVYPIEGGTHSGLIGGDYVLDGGTAEGHPLTWIAPTSGSVPSIKITASPKNNKILVAGVSTVKCVIKPGPDEPVHWAHVGVTSFAPNDNALSVASSMTAGIVPTATLDADKLSVKLVSDATVIDQKPLNITHPAHVTGTLLGLTTATAVASAGFNATARVLLNGGASYVIQDQFRANIDQSEFGGRSIFYKEDTPLRAGNAAFTRVVNYCANYVNAQPQWVAVPRKTTFNDQLQILGVPIGDLCISDRTNPNYGSFDTAFMGATLITMQTHVWHLSVDATILDTAVTANPYSAVITAISRNQATIVGTYTLVTP